MRSYGIVVLTPVFDFNFYFNAIAEPFHCQAFIPELPFEAFRYSILPRLSRMNQYRLDSLFCYPFQQGLTYKFRTIVAVRIPENVTAHSGDRDRCA